MTRIILEDMKLNKNRRKIPIKKDDNSLSPAQIKEEIKRQELFKQEQEQKQKLKAQEEKVEYKDNNEEYIQKNKKQSKVEQYFKNRINKGIKIQREDVIGKRKPRIIHKSVLIIFIICLVGGGGYLGGNFFQKANITITSKHELINYKNKQFVASKDSGANNVNFEIMITPNKKFINTTLTEPKEVSIKAEGSVTLYNEFSTKSEKISAGSFLSDSEGKTYKTNSTVSIPGYKLDSKKKIIPGQVVVNITAFLSGDVYNGSPDSFNITSFKGTTKYKKIYGKLKSPLVGGASGIMYTLDDKSKQNIESIANTSFKEELISQVKTLVPSGYIIYPGALTFSYNGIENVLSKTSEASIEINGTLSALLLKEKSLIDNIIQTSLPNIKGEELKEIQLSDLNKLTFNFTNKDQVITKDMNSVSFTLSGDIDTVWIPDIEILKTKLFGINENEVLPLFRQDPGIAQALVKIFPPWQKNIPDEPSKININLK